MNVYELIRRKRNRGVLTREEIESLVQGYVRGDVPEYQMAAWLMAVYFRGLNAEETAALTLAMMKSGQVFDLSRIALPKVDKHSTGGVGDKVSLVLAPLVAACGVCVPMVSGRGLGHTGGTLDKLESIPGFRTDLKYEEFLANLEKAGLCIIGQTQEMCPADRKMYALRDVTATVDSVPLIAASIMSKKLAEGIDGLVLDVKTGTGAFATTMSQARNLARAMMRIGSKMGKKVTALITAMWEPLGYAVGNALEVIEAIEALKGKCPMDLEEITIALGEEILLLAGRARSRAHASRMLFRALSQGQALEKFRELVRLQGGDVRIIDDYTLLPRAAAVAKVAARQGGYIRAIDALIVGTLAVELGAGRKKIGDKVDHAVGFVFRRKVGDRVESGDVVAEVHAASEEQARAIAERLYSCITISRSAPRIAGRVLARLGSPADV